MKKKTIILNDAQINLLLSLLNKELSVCHLFADNCLSSCFECMSLTVQALNNPLSEFDDDNLPFKL